MEDKSLVIQEKDNLKTALEVIGNGLKRIAIVTDNENKLLGTLNDGDVRRAFLNGYDLNSSIEKIYNKKPTVCKKDDSKNKIIYMALSKKVYQIPIVDENNIFIKVIDLASLLNERKKNKVILMAGGLGTRLKPLTDDLPKPMLNVGSKPILQTIIENFSNYGFKNIIISVNYKADIIKNYFGDGSQYGVNISYIHETKRLGTAGALSLLDFSSIQEPFFVMNSDLLTNVNFEDLLKFHEVGNSKATMCVREYDFQVPYGVISTQNEEIISIEEKPIHKFFVNAGIYVLEPSIFSQIPSNEFYDMPTLFQKLINEKNKVLSFPIHEYWVDIGKMIDYEKANNEYDLFFKGQK